MSLDRLLRPRSIAVVGGGVWCRNVLEQCLNAGFDGPLWSVHPKAPVRPGVAHVADVAALPDPPDAVFIGVNRDATIEVLKKLSKQGAGGAVCFASGFQEAVAETRDGADKQAALLQAAGDMRILGPNCYGLLNYLDGVPLWPDQHGGIPVDRGVALVTQSSNIAINLTMQTRALPVAYVATVGNQAQTGLSEISRALLDDERVTALGLHIEGIDDLAAFEAMARCARARGKPIVALKVGRSDLARAGAVSHTASLAGSAAGASALFQRLGIGEVRSLATFLESLKLLHVCGPLASSKIVSMSCSGGEAGLMADLGQAAGLDFPPLSRAKADRLRAVLGPNVSLANPLDYHTYIWGDVPVMADTFVAAASGDVGMGCVVIDFPRSDRCSVDAWAPVIEAVTVARKAGDTPLAVLASLPETMPEDVATTLMKRGIVPLSGMVEGLEAMAVAAKLGTFSGALEPILLPVPGEAGPILTEAEAKRALALFGVPVPASEEVSTAAEAVEAAERIGYPVVLKAQGIAHKTEAGALRLNLLTPRAVEEAACALLGDRILVEQMVGGAVAEVLVGVLHDQAHGYVLTLAAGGTLTELMADGVSLLVPSSADAIRDALNRLRLAPVLNGYRGQASADLDALVAAVLAVQSYVVARRPLEVEINPLICCPDGVYGADALIRTRLNHAEHPD